MAAGGVVRRNPKGREVGFGRRIRATPEGARHPMYAGKPAVFEAMTVHLDEVETLPEGAQLLANNDHSQVQAATFRAGRASCWGVQYHPEYPFREMAAIFRRLRPSLVAEGFFMDEDEEAAFIADLEHFEREPANASLAWRHGIDGGVIAREFRTLEVANWIGREVAPGRARRLGAFGPQTHKTPAAWERRGFCWMWIWALRDMCFAGLAATYSPAS